MKEKLNGEGAGGRAASPTELETMKQQIERLSLQLMEKIHENEQV